MELLIFVLGFFCAAVIAEGVLIIRLLKSARRPPAEPEKMDKKRDMTTQWENLINYDGTVGTQQPLREHDDD